MAPCLVSDKGFFDLKDFYIKIEKYNVMEVACIEIIVLVVMCKLF